MTLDQEIEEQTKLIAELESSYPAPNPSLGRWHESNRSFELHHVKVRDAYWKRRMLIAKRDKLDIKEVAKVY